MKKSNLILFALVMLLVFIPFGCSIASKTTSNSLSGAHSNATQASSLVKASSKTIQESQGHLVKLGEALKVAPTTQSVQPLALEVLSEANNIRLVGNDLSLATLQINDLDTRLDQFQRDDLAKDRTIETQKKTITDKDAKYIKLKDSTKWIGWKTWDYIVGLSITFAGLTILMLLINARYDIFVIIIKPVIWFIQGTFNAFMTLIKSIFGMFKKNNSNGVK